MRTIFVKINDDPAIRQLIAEPQKDNADISKEPNSWLLITKQKVGKKKTATVISSILWKTGIKLLSKTEKNS